MKTKNSLHRAGFTILEMMVVIVIVSLLGTLVLFGYRAFTDRLSVSAASQDIAIAVRQTQAYGLSVKQVGQGSGIFNTGYGIYFNTADPTHYTIFADANPDGVFDQGDTVVETDSTRDNVPITSVCDAGTCSPQGATAVSILFIRPKPDAIIRFSASGGTFLDDFVRIILTSTQGTASTVSVSSTGEVSTQ